MTSELRRILPALALALPSPPAAAGALDLAIGASGSTSGWPGDRAGGTTLDLAYGFRPWLQVGLLGRSSYATVDERLLSYFSVGVEVHRPAGRLRPYARVGLVHQHEEPLDAVRHQPLQSLLGVGDGIRHRAGFDALIGLELPFHRVRRGDLYAAADLLATWLPDPRGPRWYAAVGLSLGLRWDLAPRSGR